MSEICQTVGKLNICFDPDKTRVSSSRTDACPPEFGEGKQCSFETSSFSKVGANGKPIKIRGETIAVIESGKAPVAKGGNFVKGDPSKALASRLNGQAPIQTPKSLGDYRPGSTIPSVK